MDDLIWGVNGKRGIAAELGLSPAQVYYLIARGKLPVRKLGHRTIAASRTELRRFSLLSTTIENAAPVKGRRFRFSGL